MEQISFTHSTIFYNPPFMYLVLKEGAELDVEQMRELIAAAEKLSNKTPYLLISDVRVNVIITSEARKVAADKNEARFLIANAVLTNNIALKLTANFFIQFNKPHFPLKIFSDEKKAHIWLAGFLPETILPKSLRIPDLNG
jgi:hypothetical protein